MSDSGEEISKRILVYLAKMKRDFPDKKSVCRETILKDLRLDEDTLDLHVKHLSEQYLVYVQDTMPYSPWSHVSITVRGAIHAEGYFC